MKEAITVRQLIAFLQTQDQELPVAYQCCSEQVLLDLKEIGVVDLCLPRVDGWVQNRRPDMPTQKYLLLPGN